MWTIPDNELCFAEQKQKPDEYIYFHFKSSLTDKTVSNVREFTSS